MERKEKEYLKLIVEQIKEEKKRQAEEQKQVEKLKEKFDTSKFRNYIG